MTDKSPEPATSFESSLEELEKLVSEMEAGDLPLQEALTKFERGVALAKQSQDALDKAEQKVKILMQEQSGNVLADFDNSAEQSSS